MLIIKGFIIGVAKIIPGVSGAMLAISMGIYEKAIEAINNFFKKPIESIKFLFPLGIGVVLAIILTSKLIIYLLANYYLMTILLFIGLICGGIPSLFKKIDIKNIKFVDSLILILSFSLVFLISLIGKQNIFINIDNSFIKYILYFIIGSIDSITMIVPGISGTAVMMLLGCYDLMLDLMNISGLNDLIKNIPILIPFLLGVLITIIIFSKLMDYLFKKKPTQIYSGIIGFAISSILTLFLNLFKNQYNTIEIFFAIILFFVGFIISFKLENKN